MLILDSTSSLFTLYFCYQFLVFQKFTQISLHSHHTFVPCILYQHFALKHLYFRLACINKARGLAPEEGGTVIGQTYSYMYIECVHIYYILSYQLYSSIYLSFLSNSIAISCHLLYIHLFHYNCIQSLTSLIAIAFSLQCS